jgi:dolichol-phosphate mannosyltransferase
MVDVTIESAAETAAMGPHAGALALLSRDRITRYTPRGRTAPDPPAMVIITLPAYNEARTLPFLLEAIRDSMAENEIRYRVIVVNDGSRDGTAEVVDRMAGAMPIVRIDHHTNRGLGETIRTGLLRALDGADDRDIIVTMDSDNTHTPGLIARMVRGIREGNDVVVASRFQPGARSIGVPLYRRVFSRGASCLFRTLFPTPNIRDFTSGFRAYRAAVLKQAFATYGHDRFVAESGFSCMVDILLKLRGLHAIMSEVPLVLRYDLKFGVSKMLVLRTIRDTLTLLVTRRLGLR